MESVSRSTTYPEKACSRSRDNFERYFQFLSRAATTHVRPVKASFRWPTVSPATPPDLKLSFKFKQNLRAA